MKGFSAILLICLMTATSLLVLAQTTEFTYQGSLRDGASPATGNYDFEFRLFDAQSGGNQLGSPLTRSGIAAANGTFSVNLDFGNGFPGADRFLEISVRPAGGASFTSLVPRQRVASAPYSVKSIGADNAASLGGVPAPGYLQTTGNGSGLTNLNAGSITTGTLQSARIANGSLTAEKIGTGQVVKSLNGLEDNVTLFAGTNISITPAGTTLVISSTAPAAILNQTAQQQPAGFNISGDGTIGGTLTGLFVNAANRYQINGNQVLAAPASNGSLFVGPGMGIAGTDNTYVGAGAGAGSLAGSQRNTFVGRRAGTSTQTGEDNTFVGAEAGFSTQTVNEISFFGSRSGKQNTSGFRNSFFGANSGTANQSGGENSFFGYDSGAQNTASFNAFFGASAGAANTSGSSNAFFGDRSGQSNSAGTNNSFFGRSSGGSSNGSKNAFFGDSAGGSNVTGSENSSLGAGAGPAVDRPGLFNSTAIGARAIVSADNAIVLGSIAGTNGATTNTNVGIGVTAPTSRLHIVGTGTQRATISSTTNAGFQLALSNQNRWTMGTTSASNGAFTLVNEVVGVTAFAIDPTTNYIAISSLAPSGATPTAVCRNISGQFSSCASSSLRYKQNIEAYGHGLDVVQRLRPITFDWKGEETHDVGFGAEEVAKVDPLLVTKNEKGEVEGVKYDRITAALVNAVKEQQKQIEELKREVNRLKKRAANSRKR
jgi:hypothetical protein